MAKKMPIGQFVSELYAAYKRKDGYIMCATGQNPKKWAVNSWWFTQYTNADQRKKALYWREHAQRVWDCNGLAEGLYKDYSGVDINTQARYNYAQWCSPKGSGLIPAKYRVPGAAVFWGTSAANIHHVAYLYKPVKDGVPNGDWYIIEARGVNYGVVETRLLSRRPNYWGWMTKYFDYDQSGVSVPTDAPAVSTRILRNGDEGEDVKQMQTNLIRLGYDCGRWGADGDFGDATEMALKKFQSEHGLEADGKYGPLSKAAMDKAIADLEKPHSEPRKVKISGGNCYVRTAPNTDGKVLGVAHDGDSLDYGGLTSENGWNLVDYKGVNGWVSGKYSKLVG
jgi:hypothetical protein